MRAPETTLHLAPTYFGERERLLLEHSTLKASAFRYDSGVCALRLVHDVGELVMLPFQGQQIWSARFLGRDLTMRSMFDRPNATRTYLENYGGFLIHCGATAMGVPTASDSHLLHGELPNAPYQSAWITAGTDEQGSYLDIGGRYEHIVAFSHHYAAEPVVRLRAGSSVVEVSLQVTNLKRSEMELMYLAHANFRPVDGGRLVYSAQADPAHVRVRASIPSHVRVKPGYAEFLDQLRRDPQGHHLLAPGLAFDPEVVFFVDYLADAEGWAHTLQVHPDGSADVIRHRPEQLPKGVRWICRTPDQDAIGISLPATAEPEGYSAEKAKGNLVIVPPGGIWTCNLELGALDASAASAERAMIERLLSKPT